MGRWGARVRTWIDEVGEKRDGDSYDFELFHGSTSFNYRVFPSMHAMPSFAVASALTQEMRRLDTPHRGVIAPVLNAGAVIPSLSRMHLDERWSSAMAIVSSSASWLVRT